MVATIAVKIHACFGARLSPFLRRRLASGEDLAVHLPPGRDINHLLTELWAMGLMGPFHDMILVSVNGKLQETDYVLGPNDVVDLHITMAGG